VSQQPPHAAIDQYGAHMAAPFSLLNRTALITGTGAQSGIGFATARLLARQGARVVLSATTERVFERVGELLDLGLDAHGVISDLTLPGAPAELVRAANEHLGSLDILVNNAGMIQTGVSIESGNLADQPPLAWARQLEITLMTAVAMTRVAIPLMREQGYGRIVMMSSVTGPLVSAAGSSAYSAAKGGMDGLMRAVAIEEGPNGITCNSVAPGWIHTGSASADEIAAGGHTPVGRPGTADEVAAVVGFLASDEASYVTGQPFVVDGGNIIQEFKGPNS
jgi:3-oxoacyl-[acyl-carrier protein] reductase